MPGDVDVTAIDTRQIARRVGLFILVAIVAALAVSALPGVDQVRDRLSSGDPLWIGVAGLCSLGSMIGFVAALMGAFDRVVPLRPAIFLGFAEQGTNVLLPAGGAGGPAFGTLVMRRAGVPGELAAERHAVLFLVTSAVGFCSLVLFGTLEAAGALPGDVSFAASAGPALLGVVVLGASLAFAHASPPVGEAPSGRVRGAIWRLRRFLHEGVSRSLVLLRRHDPLLALGAVAYYALDIAALAAAFEAFGGGAPSLGVFVLAYTLGHAGALVPTPGGVGGTDGGLIGMFALYGTELDLATAAVLGYRVFQLGLPVVLGAVSLARIRRGLRTGPTPEEVAARYTSLER